MKMSKPTFEVEPFMNLWNAAFPNALPVSHLLKHQLADRWFRIHSLPESKRYAESPKEYEVMLFRQNEVATDVLGENSDVFIVAGEFDWDDQQQHVVQYDEALQAYEFFIMESINLFQFDQGEFEENQTYTPAIGRTTWALHKHDDLLVDVAKDRSRAFFVSFANNSIFSPYDGGADFIVKDSIARDSYKRKYKAYLSLRHDGY